MISIQALARSDLPLPQGQVWQLHSRFTQAINLTDASGRLLTLHRFGKGCSPTGWLFRRNDFDLLAEQLTSDNVLRVEGEYLAGRRFRISARRRLNLSVPQYSLSALPDLRFYATPTGLVGPLNKACEQPDHPLLLQLRAGMSLWWEGEKPDWRTLIGLGPGLTPSGDDMLTGAMAALYSHVRPCTFSQTHTFLPSFSQLAELTTPVSCTYLENAEQGRFSTPLLRLVRCLAARRDSRSAVENLLAHGHTSGADTLIGLVTALRWLEERRKR